MPTAAFGGFSPEISRESFAKFCLEGCESVKSNFPLGGAKFLQRPSHVLRAKKRGHVSGSERHLENLERHLDWWIRAVGGSPAGPCARGG